jgi:ATP-dependent DNA ligase
MPAGFIETCSSIASGNPPSGPNLLEEIKHDGYRLIVRKASSPVRVFTRLGFE